MWVWFFVGCYIFGGEVFFVWFGFWLVGFWVGGGGRCLSICLVWFCYLSPRIVFPTNIVFRNKMSFKGQFEENKTEIAGWDPRIKEIEEAEIKE